MRMHGSVALTAVVLTVFACLAAYVQGADRDQSSKVGEALFRIPVSGSPGELVGGIQYQGPSAFAFDSRNHPYFLHTFKNTDGDKRPDLAGVITTWRNGKWIQLSFRSAIQDVVGDFQFALLPHGLGSITFDADDGLYLISQTTKGTFLVYSPDLGKSFQAYELPTRAECGAFLETRTGHNLREGAPAIGLLYYVGEEKICRWSYLSKLSVVVPEKKDGRLVLQPVEITRNCFAISNHSGGYSFAATVGNLTHVVYGEYDPAVKGNPTWVATFDRTSHKVVARKHLFNAHPDECDVHSTPVITVDSRGYLHILGGAHNGPFLYTQSLKPNTIEGAWTEPAPMHDGQTYATLVCDKNDVLHSVYRAHPRLLYQSKPAAASEWSEPRPLAVAPWGSGKDWKDTGFRYTCFYHQLAVDRSDCLYLCFTFREMKPVEVYPRALIASDDQGATWRLVRTDAIQRRLVGKEKEPSRTERIPAENIVD